MRTVGEILKQERLKKGLSLEGVEKVTKIRTKFLELIEKDDFSKIPQGTICRGFIRNYAQVLGLGPEGILAVFRRDFIEDEKGQIVPRGMASSLNKFRLSWNPKLTFFLFFALVMGLFFGFLIKQYLNYTSLPEISVFSPSEGQVFKKNQIEFLGRTDKDISLYIDGEIVNLDSTGEFKKTFSLTRGENEFVLEAIDRRGQKTRLVRKVTFLESD